MRSLELRIPPVALVVVFAAAMAAVSYLVPGAHFVIPARLVAGLALALLGALAALAGVLGEVDGRRCVSIRAPVRARPAKDKCLQRIGEHRQPRETYVLGAASSRARPFGKSLRFGINELSLREPSNGRPVACGSHQKIRGALRLSARFAPTCSTRLSHFAPNW